MNQDKGLDGPRAWTAHSTLHTSVGIEVEIEGRERGYTIDSLRIWLTNQFSWVNTHTHGVFKLEPHKKFDEKRKEIIWFILHNGECIGWFGNWLQSVGGGAQTRKESRELDTGQTGVFGKMMKIPNWSGGSKISNPACRRTNLGTSRKGLPSISWKGGHQSLQKPLSSLHILGKDWLL